ncbi:MarR family transcriptional regulator [Arthrobacter sp. SA17]
MGRLPRLLHLVGRRPLEPHRLASFTSMSRAAISAARKALEAQQLVTSVASSTDQRSILMSLTPQGGDLTREIHERAMRNATATLSALTLPSSTCW